MKETLLYQPTTLQGIRRWASVGLLGLLFAGCGEISPITPYPQAPGSNASPAATGISGVTAHTFIIPTGDCVDVPTNSVIQGDIVMYPNRQAVQNSNGQFVGGATFYDSDPNTGNITITSTNGTACAEWGASGATTADSAQAAILANTYTSDLRRQGCQNQCSSVSITHYP